MFLSLVQMKEPYCTTIKLMAYLVNSPILTLNHYLSCLNVHYLLVHYSQIFTWHCTWRHFRIFVVADSFLYSSAAIWYFQVSFWSISLISGIFFISNFRRVLKGAVWMQGQAQSTLSYSMQRLILFLFRIRKWKKWELKKTLPALWWRDILNHIISNFKSNGWFWLDKRICICSY